MSAGVAQSGKATDLALLGPLKVANLFARKRILGSNPSPGAILSQK